MSETTENQRAVIGDNSGFSIPTQAELRDFLAQRYTAEVKRAGLLLDGAERFHEQTAKGIQDDDVMAKSSDFVAQIGRLTKTLESLRTGEKVTYDQLGSVIQSFFKAGLIDALDKAKNSIANKQAIYLREKERLARIEADKAREKARAEAQEAADKAAAALRAEQAAEAERQAAIKAGQAVEELPAIDTTAADEAISVAKAAEKTAVAIERRATASSAELTRTRGDFGGTTSLRTVAKMKLVDITKVPADYLLLNESMVKAKGRGWKDGDPQPVPGIEFYEDRVAGTRG